MGELETMEKAAIAGGEPAKTVPFTRWPKFDGAELEQLKEALDQGTLFYAFGEKVKTLNRRFAEMIGAKHCVATSSGTASIHVALMAAGVSPGDEVIVSPVTDMGSVLPILWQQAVPVFADIHPTRHGMTRETVEAAITERTKAVVLVHLWGNPAEPAAIRQLCDERGIVLVEDCAQAYGAREGGQWVGRFGHIGCFSLNDFKHISCGDGGMVVTDDDNLARRMTLSADKGYSRDKDAAERNPTFLCGNYRMSELQAAVAIAQLDKLASIVENRQRWCGELVRRIGNLPGLVMPEVTPNSEASWWFFMLRVDPQVLGATADEFAEAMAAEKVPLGAHYIGKCVYEYPVFVNHSAYERGGHPYDRVAYGKGMCPQAEDLLAHCLILPINEGFTEQDLDETVRAFEKCVAWAQGRTK